MTYLKRLQEEKANVLCETKEELEDLLKKCEKENIKWFSGRKATSLTLKHAPCYILFSNLYIEYCCSFPHRDSKTYKYKDIFKEEITITKYDNKVVAKYNDKVGVAKCAPEDEFNFETGAKLALERLFEKKEFKPYLKFKFSKENYGYIGEETDFTLPFNEKLYIGDVVELFNTKNNYNYGTSYVYKIGDEYSVMWLTICKFKNGISGEWQIRKVKSYKDLNNGEEFCDIKAVLEEDK